jgi:outer membrane beta-barrel protein
MCPLATTDPCLRGRRRVTLPKAMRVFVASCALLAALPSVGWGQEGARRAARVADAEEDPPEAGESAIAEPEPSPTRVSCLEDASEDGYQRKGVQKRDFIKRHRFELAALGGFHAADMMSSTYTFGGALSFFPSEDFGFEGLVTYAPVRFRLELPFNSFDGRLRFHGGHALQALGALVFSPVHAKFKAGENTIVHGDLFLTAGAGRTFHDSVQGLSWQVGAGFKLYLGNHFAFRFDVRDVMLPQEVLARARLTHNLTVLGGFGLWVL